MWGGGGGVRVRGGEEEWGGCGGGGDRGGSEEGEVLVQAGVIVVNAASLKWGVI